MNFLKKAEQLNKKIVYTFLDLIFRNREASLPLQTGPVRKILLFRYDAIGDMIVTTPVFQLIREKMPQAEIHVVCSPYNYPIVQHDERVKKFFLHDGSSSSFFRLIRAARRERYNLVLAYVLFRTTYAGTLANLAGGPGATKVTILHKERKKLYSTFFNVQIGLERDSCTMAELQVKMLCELFGWDYRRELVRMAVRIDENSLAAAEKFSREHQLVDFTLLNISAGREYRRWSVQKNRDFIRQCLEREPGRKFVILGSPQDLEEAQAIAADFPSNALVFPPTNNILEVCALVGRAGLVVSPDTSIVHIASAMKRPVLAFYSYATTYVMEWLPFDVPNRVLISENKLPIETIATETAVERYFELTTEIGR